MLAAARARGWPAIPGSLRGSASSVGEAERLPFADGEFDALTFTYLLRYVDDRAATMRELARVVKPGGRIGMVEFGVPRVRPLRALWRALHARRAAAARPARLSRLGRGRAFPRAEHRASCTTHEPDLSALWRAAGIADVRERRMSFGAGIVMWGVRDGDRAA